jgi:lipopolysaccharide heptosyltransferase I
MAEPRFLVLRLGSLGDIVHTFPGVAALREAFPASEIVWLTHPRWSSLVKSSGLASEVRNIEPRSLNSLRGAIRQVRSSEWDAAIDYQGLWKSAALPFFGGVARRIGFSSHTIREYGVPLLYSDRVEAETTHIAEQNGELSMRVGARRVSAQFALGISPENEAAVRAQLQRCGVERYVVLSPGGGWRSKCWPAERFGALCREIRESLGLRCVVNYGPGEDDLGKAVRAASGDTDPLLYDGELGQLMAMLLGATCIVGGDTGPLHLAIALGTPAVALYGPTDPKRNGPYHVTSTPISARQAAIGEVTAPYFGDDIVLRAANATRTHARIDQTDPSMLAIDVPSVFAALKRRIGAAA